MMHETSIPSPAFTTAAVAIEKLAWLVLVGVMGTLPVLAVVLSMSGIPSRDQAAKPTPGAPLRHPTDLRDCASA